MARAAGRPKYAFKIALKNKVFETVFENDLYCQIASRLFARAKSSQLFFACGEPVDNNYNQLYTFLMAGLTLCFSETSIVTAQFRCILKTLKILPPPGKKSVLHSCPESLRVIAQKP